MYQQANSEPIYDNETSGVYQPTTETFRNGHPGPMPGMRPLVNPDETGEVDVSKYPQPKDATTKIRGKYDIIEKLCGKSASYDLTIAKAFYFFFFSAFGSLLPLMAIYFKNMGMTATQAGVLIGIRPFVEYLSAPFWADMAERFRKGKLILLCSLAAWIVFNVPLGFIHPPTTSCLIYNVTTDQYFIDIPKNKVLRKRDIHHASSWDETSPLMSVSQQELAKLRDLYHQRSMDVELGMHRFVRIKREDPFAQPKPNHVIGKSPYSVDFAINYDPKDHKNYVSPTFSYTIFTKDNVSKVFMLFLLLVLIGEFFCCPSLTLADSAVLNLLGKENADQYGKQRMFASLGWGLTMFIVTLILDHSHSFRDHPCQVHPRERSYVACYATFTVLMSCAIFVATQLPFTYSSQPNSGTSTPGPAQSVINVGSTYRPPGSMPPGFVPKNGQPKQKDKTDVIKQILGKSKVFAKQTKKIPEWMPVLRHFSDLRCASFLFVAWFMGFGIGLIFTFLFWHLQDYGGTATLFGVASVVNHVSEILAYFFSFKLIRKIGHIKVLCIGLAANVTRFLYISWISEPWGVMPFEFIQGITHSAVWAAASSFVAYNTPQELRGSAQAVLAFVHNGLGRGCGAIIGGMIATSYGTTTLLRGYGFTSLFVLIAFIIVCYYRPETGFVSDLTQEEDPRQVQAEMSHLAPHGVPGNPTIPLTPSSVPFDDRESISPKYTSENTSLGIQQPGYNPNNPFLSSGGSASVDPLVGAASYSTYNQQDFIQNNTYNSNFGIPDRETSAYAPTNYGTATRSFPSHFTTTY
ncbi:major facilitator superfamily domain-containing protein 6-like isoform X2 [Artemia franciscana]|uniref:major facilitator superfamily domain-containing protein 6-like isoform X2 n=1 Tax=Artemia franciscana TaxID=6661 RepID=UPI0032DB646E